MNKGGSRQAETASRRRQGVGVGRRFTAQSESLFPTSSSVASPTRPNAESPQAEVSRLAAAAVPQAGMRPGRLHFHVDSASSFRPPADSERKQRPEPPRSSAPGAGSAPRCTLGSPRSSPGGWRTSGDLPSCRPRPLVPRPVCSFLLQPRCTLLRVCRKS